jgi:hypothetical protein
MKRLVLFIVLALCLDRLIGAGLSVLERRTQAGDRSGALNYALTRDAGILVLGSSRAKYQIMPAVLSRKLGVTAFNAGLKGQDFLYSVMLFDLWKMRHEPPRALVLTIEMESLIERESEVAAAQIVAPHIDESELVREVLYSASPYKPIEYQLRAYRYNGQVFSILRHFRTRVDPRADGFEAGVGQYNPNSDEGTVVNALDQHITQMEMAGRPYSGQKLRYLRSLAEWSSHHGSRLFLVHTPLYRQDHDAHALWMSRLRAVVATLPGTEIVDLCTESHPELFAGKPEIYLNQNHLNGAGAEILSELLAQRMAVSLAQSPGIPRDEQRSRTGP